LSPEQLLELFLDAQGKMFVDRFAEASAALESSLEDIQTNVSWLSGLIFNEINHLADQVDQQLDDISSMADETSSLAEDAQADSQSALEYLHEFDRKFDFVIEDSRNNFTLLSQITEHLNLDSIKRLNDRRGIQMAFGIMSALPDDQNDMDSILKLMRKRNPEMSPVIDSFSYEEITEIYESATKD
jgi:hypothetical protein